MTRGRKRQARASWHACRSLTGRALAVGLAAVCLGGVALSRAHGQTSVGIVRVDGDAPLYIEQMVRDAVALAGGLGDIISPGDVVVIKPNLVQDYWVAGEGVTTDPRVVSAVVKVAKEAGAGVVFIAEGTASSKWGDRMFRDITRYAFHDSGYDADWDGWFDYDTSVQLVDLNDAGGLDQHDPTKVTLVNVPNGIIRTEYYVPNIILNCDVLISVPTFKNHGQGSVTLSLKNRVGCAPNDIYHHSGSASPQMKWCLLHSCSCGFPCTVPPPPGSEEEIIRRTIVDLNLARPQEFAVVDALVGITNGPCTDPPAHPDPYSRMIVAGRDSVAVDAVGTLAMGYDLLSIDQIQYAAGLLGTADVAEITVLGKSVDNVRYFFPAPYGGATRVPDITPPTMTGISIQNGDLVSGTETVTATGVSDDVGVVKCDLVAYPLGANLVANGDFETGQASPWQEWSATWGSSYAWEYDNTEFGRLGSYCLKLGGASTSGSFGVYQQVAVDPGKTYRLDAYWKGQKANSQSWFEILLLDGPFSMAEADTGGAAVVQPNFMYAYDNGTYGLPGTSFGWIWGHDQYSPPKNQVDWNNRRGQRTASGTVMTVVLKAGTSGAGGIAAWFDGVSLREVSTERSFASAPVEYLDWDVTGLPGGEYEVTVSAYDACLNEARITRTVTVAAATEPGFYQPGWNLTSVPVDPYDPDATAVFWDLIALGNVITNNLYRYAPGVGYEMYPLAFSDVDRGRGYWLWLDTVPGDTVVSVGGEAATAEVAQPLSVGWSLMGHPFQKPVPLSACQVTDGVTTLSFDDAVAAGWITGALYYWRSTGGYGVLHSGAYGHDDSLRAWRGYWVNANAPGLQLVIPRPS